MVPKKMSAGRETNWRINRQTQTDTLITMLPSFTGDGVIKYRYIQFFTTSTGGPRDVIRPTWRSESEVEILVT